MKAENCMSAGFLRGQAAENHTGEAKMTFKQLFFRIYDRKIMSGEITFSQSGIERMISPGFAQRRIFVFSKENLNLIFEKMQLNEEEKERRFLMRRKKFAAGAGKDADGKVT